VALESGTDRPEGFEFICRKETSTGQGGVISRGNVTFGQDESVPIRVGRIGRILTVGYIGFLRKKQSIMNIDVLL